MILQLIFLTLFSSSYAKIGQEKSLFNVNSSRKLSNCGASNSMFQEYEETSVSLIPEMDDGTKVMVTSKVNPDPIASCTMMMCTARDTCCNKCQSGLLMGNILLDSPELVCAGTNCDYTDKCTYQQGDVITVYGKVSGSTIKVKGHCLVGSQNGLRSNCGDPRGGYTQVEVESIGPDMAGQSVMVTSSPETPGLAACTRMGCSDENQCCNSCHADSSFGDIYLIDSGENRIGCQGTECDWEDNCVYASTDIVTVYGTVGEDGNIIYIHDHCKVGYQISYNNNIFDVALLP